MDKIKLSIFASGSGSNADKICSHLRDHTELEVASILTNKEDAGVREVASRHQVLFQFFPNSSFKEGAEVLKFLQSHHIQGIVLAGFLRKIPSLIIEQYPDRILNIHPALLPKYGGKGMYGRHVHEAVKAAGETHSGPTIHLVNEDYDDGAILFQAQTSLSPDDQAEDIGRKVLALEHQYYPRVVESYFLEIYDRSNRRAKPSQP